MMRPPPPRITAATYTADCLRQLPGTAHSTPYPLQNVDHNNVDATKHGLEYILCRKVNAQLCVTIFFIVQLGLFGPIPAPESAPESAVAGASESAVAGIPESAVAGVP